MTRLYRKGDRVRLLVPCIGGWQGEAIVWEDEEPECGDDLIYFRRVGRLDSELPPGCCVRQEIELIKAASDPQANS